MTILWSQNLATGINTIDAQHRELFKRIKTLIEIWTQDKDKMEIDKIIPSGIKKLVGFIIQGMLR